MEDILELIDDYNKEVMSYDSASRIAKTRRILFINGTTFSERPNQIMGKMVVEASYRQDKINVDQLSK